MKPAPVLIAILLFAVFVPLTNGIPERRNFEITSLTINFDKTDAIFTLKYDLGNLPKFYVLLMGSKSMEPKIESIFSNFDYTILKLDHEKAVLSVKNISRFEKGYYLHESRKFGDTIDTIYIITPDSPRIAEYYNIDSTPNKFYR